MTIVTHHVGLYHYAPLPAERLCVDCVIAVLEADPTMTRDQWQQAEITPFDAECCDSCDCVPAAEGKPLTLDEVAR